MNLKAKYLQDSRIFGVNLIPKICLICIIFAQIRAYLFIFLEIFVKIRAF